jgi:site-specific recombinase XerD
MPAVSTKVQCRSLGKPYLPARGRYAPRAQVDDYLQDSESVVQGYPSANEFVETIVRELRIRFYQPKTVKSYRNAIRSFLRWFGTFPHRVTREDVREYLLYLVDAGAASGTVANHLAAIRTAFDKFCLRRVTLGLAVPRRPHRLPVVLSAKEVIALLQAAPSLRDKLLLGLMYATGVRVSEVVRLRWRDVDLDRRTINIWQGKGRSDRQVMLPQCYESLLTELSKGFCGEDFLFPGDRRGRHLSPRTAQRVMQRAVAVAGIKKRATPHSLRHNFATHSFENGCDIRRIRKLLGHVRLETTTIYVKVARMDDEPCMPSPLDKLYQPLSHDGSHAPRRSVGHLRLHFQQQPDASGCPTAKVTIEVQTPERPVYFTGTFVSEARPGFVTLQIPPLEQWDDPLKWISRSQRERFQEPGFYRLLQREITTRFCRLTAAPS